MDIRHWSKFGTYGNALLCNINRPPHYIDGVIKYKNFTDDGQNTTVIGRLAFLTHQIGKCRYLYSNTGNYKVWIADVGQTQLKGQEPVHSIQITVQMEDLYCENITTTTALIDQAPCGEQYMASLITMMLERVTRQYINALMKVGGNG